MLFEYKSEIPYKDIQDCTMEMKCPNNNHIAIDVQLFDIEPHSFCIYDYVQFNGVKKCGVPRAADANVIVAKSSKF